MYGGLPTRIFHTMILSKLDDYLRELLHLEDYARMDASLNGIQVGDRDREVKKVAVAVDAAQATIDRAAEWGADLLFVHHGFFWGSPLAVTGSHYTRVKKLIDANIALYAVHLPLDAHAPLGNNAQMANHIGLQDQEPFGAYKGVPIGWSGTLPQPASMQEIARALFSSASEPLGMLPMGKGENKTVAIVSGGAPESAREAIACGIDLFITGDASHVIYHDCMEAGINVMFGGHYNTEIWGVRAVGRHLAEQLGLEYTFIDLPTGL